ncbi:dephospho-CoA kinase [Myroides phaeus]|uniref:Dephospho-CoA kinase n=1 Tax=Myroides phaeus TaxID=702745 RepID=A0A1G8GJ82_9FLAO|nr:dephospho-CoA kinase [Myroides phaeus]MEC4115892.1 dephospho-CoA kinase [Myroides phaeus]SDH94433.1 dephospho-CoA kinase [Myroides phaeus]
MALIVGLTGGIGSGKTTVAKMFASEGIPVYISDERAKAIMDRPDVVAAVQALFEENIMDGPIIDRKKLRNIVFNNKTLLDQLNKIVHPEVKKDFITWVEEHRNFKFVLKESAILFEKDLDKECDFVVLVTAPEEVRIQRVMARDGVSSQNVQAIIANQMKDSLKILKSDYVIANINKEQVKKEVKMIIADINCKI